MKKILWLAAAVLFVGAVAMAGNNLPRKETAKQKENKTMKVESAPFLYESELQWESPVPGLKRQIMGHNDELMIVKIDFEPGCDGGGPHSHPHSQCTVVVSGVFEVTIDGQTRTLKAGDGFYAAPGKVHMAKCIERGTLIDSFSPVREDFLKK